MRSFSFSTIDRKNDQGYSTIHGLIVDKDKGSMVRMEMPYGEIHERTRDTAHAFIKDLASHAIRYRVAAEYLTTPECPNGCTKGYYKAEDDDALCICENLDCQDYVEKVLNITDTVDTQVAYQPDPSFDDTDFAL
jgi:hypothetical protein